MSFLLDTNVISEARRPQGNPQVKNWLATLPSSSIFLSVLVVGEIRQGIATLQRRDPAQSAVYEIWLNRLRQDYGDHILPITTEIAELWGGMNYPDPVPIIDGLIAATAQVHGLTVATRNTADFIRTGVALFNPFEG